SGSIWRLSKAISSCWSWSAPAIWLRFASCGWLILDFNRIHNRRSAFRNEAYMSATSSTMVTRRQAIASGGAAALGAMLSTRPVLAGIVKNGRLKQSVSRWCYKSIPLPDLCRAAADMGLTAIDLLDEPDWAVVREYGLICSMAHAGGGSIRDGLNVVANHDAIVANFTRTIPRPTALK